MVALGGRRLLVWGALASTLALVLDFVPLFDLLGTPAADKRHVIFETGHALPLSDVGREMLPWLERYLGRVKSPGSAITPTTPVAR